VISSTDFVPPTPGAGESRIPSFIFRLPSGTVTQGSLGIVLGSDIATSDIGDVATAGVVAALSDGTGTLYSPLTIRTNGQLTVASSGDEIIAIGLAPSTGGAIWCRVVQPFLL
jgi:hypothetical protein